MADCITMKYVGLDVHKDTIVIAVAKETSRVVWWERCPTT